MPSFGFWFSNQNISNQVYFIETTLQVSIMTETTLMAGTLRCLPVLFSRVGPIHAGKNQQCLGMYLVFFASNWRLTDVAFLYCFSLPLILKGTGHYLLITQNICSHKNLLGNEQWRVVDSIKQCEKRLPLKVISHSITNKRLHLKPFIIHLKAHKVMQHVFFVHCSLATSMTSWAQMFTGLLFYGLDTPSENTALWQITKRVQCL